MKILHFADLHIGVENHGFPDPQTGVSTRLLDFLRTYDEMIEYAIDQEVDLVVFAGDAYKVRDPSQTHQKEFANRIIKLANNNIPTYLVAGNHDLPAISGKANALEVFPIFNQNMVHVSDQLNTSIIKTKSGPIQVIGLPWIKRSQFLTRKDTQSLQIDKITELLEDRLTRSLMWEIEKLDSTIPAILVGHVTVAGATVGTERSMMLGRDHTILTSTLASPLLDYIALGHIHKHQILARNPHVVYAGSLQRVDFSEENEAKGFCEIELDPEKQTGSRMIDFKFNPVAAREFLTIDIDIVNKLDPNQQIAEQLQKTKVNDAVVRVRINVDESISSLIEEASIRKHLNEAHFITSITKNIQRTNRTRITAEASKGLSYREALDLYMNSINLDTQKKTELMESLDKLIFENEQENEY